MVSVNYASRSFGPYKTILNEELIPSNFEEPVLPPIIILVTKNLAISTIEVIIRVVNSGHHV